MDTFLQTLLVITAIGTAGLTLYGVAKPKLDAMNKGITDVAKATSQLQAWMIDRFNRQEDQINHLRAENQNEHRETAARLYGLTAEVAAITAAEAARQNLEELRNSQPLPRVHPGRR